MDRHKLACDHADPGDHDEACQQLGSRLTNEDLRKMGQGVCINAAHPLRKKKGLKDQTQCAE